MGQAGAERSYAPHQLWALETEEQWRAAPEAYAHFQAALTALAQALEAVLKDIRAEMRS